MNKPVRLFLRFFFHEPTIYLIFCTGIVYSMFLWPLLNSIFCISLGTYWLLFSQKSFRFKSIGFRLVVLFVSLYLVSVIGMLYTSNLPGGFSILQKRLSLILFPFVLGCSKAVDQKLTRTIFTHFILATIFTVILGLCQGLIHQPSLSGAGAMDVQSFIFGGNYPYTIGLSCLLSLVIIKEKLYDAILQRTWLLLFSAVFLSAYLLFLNVRLVSGCWLGLLIYYIFRLFPGWGHRLLISLSVICIALFAFFKIPYLHNKWEELKDYHEKGIIMLDKDASLGRSWGGLSIRAALWKCSTDLIRRHPLTGVGTGDTQDSLQQVYEDHKFYFASRYNRYNIHNEYLNMLLGTGAVGLAVLLACIAGPSILLKGDPFSRIRGIFLLLFVLICFTEVILDTDKGVIWYSFFNSIFAFGAGQKEN